MPAQKQRGVPKRIAQTILHSLKGGVVPRIGLPYITVGRKAEIEALLHDFSVVADGGASFHFIVGKYGSGKSFLLQTMRNYVMDKGFVVVDGDLSPERRLQGTKGQGLATYRELVQNMATKTRPEGGALPLILDRWISSVQSKVAASGKAAPSDVAAFGQAVDQEIYRVISSLNELVHGFDFARLLKMYYHAYLDDDDETKAKVIKWFRGEYDRKTDAKNELGVNIIISDSDWYEYLKLFAVFFRQAGYAGLIIMIDELVNIFKIPNSISRQYNYEKILTMYNDTLQGKAKYLGILMGGTPQAIEDKRRGVYSYEALRSRLTQGKFADVSDARDMYAPVIKLAPLTADEMLVLTEKLAAMHAGLYGYSQTITEEQLAQFIKIEYARIGSSTNITPREVIRDFIELLDILWQNPSTKIEDLLNSDRFDYAKKESTTEDNNDNAGDYTEFTLD
ncbi:MAG TPA: ATP-binding protein [Candidatus Limosilactobacillus merdipullorum]|uniref:ATP-binding protein n=1 Tax=Candidatus Limosilactobacillus merdipullorum TaxID=2838653 RepID=A0A9D1QQT8_9LACO|nr:ATP-binding protein [Candidatus Limosilactobacillus merdipullorum]